MNLFADIRELVVGELAALAAEGKLPTGLDFAAVAVEPPRDPGHGHLATNAAMVLAKPAGMAPRVIADMLALRLMEDPRVAGADVAGPGFLNLRLVDQAWQGLVRYFSWCTPISTPARIWARAASVTRPSTWA